MQKILTINRFVLTLFMLLISAFMHAKQKVVYFEDYYKTGSSKYATLVRAVADIDGKRLILPSDSFDIGNLAIEGHKNFSIVGNSTIISCGDFTIKNSSDFEIKGIGIRGTVNKFAYFNIIGNCSNFKIHDCTFDSQKDVKGENMLYGIHVICDTSNPLKSYQNSPRHFSIYNNRVSNTRYDGILLHANCSDFDVYHNNIENASCIGVEVEGRLGGMQNTTVRSCRNAKIYKNIIRNCGDWGILLMWVDNINVCYNECLNNYGCFLSIGCKNAMIKQNCFEGTSKGFEISQEFYSLDKGVNDGVKIYNNIIEGPPRASLRGTIDFRHCKNVIFRHNKIIAVPKTGGAQLSIVSADSIDVDCNTFSIKGTGKSFPRLLRGNANDPETGKVSTMFDNGNIKLMNNTFEGKK